MKIAISDCIVCTVKLWVVVTKFGEVYCKWWVLSRSASAELTQDVVSAHVRSCCVQTGFWCIPHLMRVSHSLDNTLYFRGTGKYNYSPSISFLCLSIIIGVIVVEILVLRFKIISGDHWLYSHG